MFHLRFTCASLAAISNALLQKESSGCAVGMMLLLIPFGCADASNPNSPGVKFYNLYFDTIRIIYPCANPEDRPAQTDGANMFGGMFDYVDRKFEMFRPRKLVFHAFDGGTCRAKTSQKCSGRFRLAREMGDRE